MGELTIVQCGARANLRLEARRRAGQWCALLSSAAASASDETTFSFCNKFQIAAHVTLLAEQVWWHPLRCLRFAVLCMSCRTWACADCSRRTTALPRQISRTSSSPRLQAGGKRAKRSQGEKARLAATTDGPSG